MSGGMVWSATLSSRLPGSPVAMKNSGVVNEQPRSPRMERTDESVEPMPLCKEMKPHFLELRLLMEYKLLGEQNISGVYILPSQQSSYDWHGVLFVHDGPWKGGIYRFSILIPDEYPRARPMVRFRTAITHPYVRRNNGQVNLYKVMSDWDPTKSHIHEVVSAVRSSFLLPDVWELENKEEEKKMIDSYRRCALNSTSAVLKYQDDNGPENLLRLVDNGDELIDKAKKLIHSELLPSGEDCQLSTSVLDQLSAHVSQFIGNFIGSS